MFNRTDMKLESLQRQLEFLGAVRGRHLTWAGDTEDPAVKQKHLEITDTIEETIKQYEALLYICLPKTK